MTLLSNNGVVVVVVGCCCLCWLDTVLSMGHSINNASILSSSFIVLVISSVLVVDVVVDAVDDAAVGKLLLFLDRKSSWGRCN